MADKNYFSLRVSSPCDEPWDQMHDRPNGRFCDSCQKTVIDFSHMSDQQLVDFFRDYQPSGSLCGRLRPSQQNRLIEIPALSQSYYQPQQWRKWAAMLALGTSLLATNPVQAAHVQPQPYAWHLAQNLKPDAQPEDLSNSVELLHGVVLDALDQTLPIANASVVLILGDTWVAKTTTNEKGEFAMTLPSSIFLLLSENVKLSVQGPNYEATIQVIQRKKLNEYTKIYLQPILSVPEPHQIDGGLSFEHYKAREEPKPEKKQKKKDK